MLVCLHYQAVSTTNIDSGGEGGSDSIIWPLSPYIFSTIV